MRVPLDECVDRRLAREIVGHDVRTVPEMGWAASKNGALLALAEGQFDAFVTVDRNVAFQQNLPRFQIAVFLLSAPKNTVAELRSLVPELLRSLPYAKHGEVVTVGL